MFNHDIIISMKKYTIFCDLDGTLLNNKSKISKETVTYIKKLIKKGHNFIITTGRPYSASINFYHQLGLNGPMINDNGAHIHYPNNPNFKEKIITMDKNSHLKIFNFAKDFLVSASFSRNYKYFIYKFNDNLKWLFHSKINDYKIYEKPFTEIESLPTNVIYIIKDKDSKKFIDYINKNHPEIGIRWWQSVEKYYARKDERIYETFIKGISKGKALNYLIDLYNIDKSTTISFGDDVNDEELVSYTNLGIAMKNGRPSTIKKAKTISRKTNDEDGVIDYLKNVLKL